MRHAVPDDRRGPSQELLLDGLERGLLLLNDLPGISAQAKLDPGSEPGTTRLSVDVTEGPLISGSAWADNFGNRYTGAERLNAQVNWNNPSGAGDQASGDWTVVTRDDGSRQWAYKGKPVYYWGEGREAGRPHRRRRQRRVEARQALTRTP